MKRAQILFVIIGFALAGCSGESGDFGGPVASEGSGSTGTAPADPDAGGRKRTSGGPTAGEPASTPGGAAQRQSTDPASEPEQASDEAASAATSVPIENGVVSLAPENARIGFIGVHTDTSREDRVGGFEKFTGKIAVDPAAKTIESIAVEIETESLWSPFEKLTNHLKSADFLEVREFPTISFQSTGIEAGEGAEHQITGKLTLHGVEKEVRFPAKIRFRDDGLVLHSSFVIDRTEFGMDKLLDQVKPELTVTVAVGEKTQPQQAGGFGAGAGRGGRGGGFGGPGRGFGGQGGGFDPGAFFDQRDANKDGKLTGDEIPERMRENLEETDTDKDGAISKEEFQARMSQFGRGGRGRGGRGGFGGRGGGFDPDALFDRLDADSDGKLAGDEIPDPMREGLDQIDTDKDGAISKEEFQARMRQFGRGGRGGGQRQRPESENPDEYDS